MNGGHVFNTRYPMTQSFLQHCFSSLRFWVICSCTALLWCCHSISIRLGSGLLTRPLQSLIVLFFSRSGVGLLVCFRSLSWCMTQFRPSFSCWTDGLTIASRIRWYAEGFMDESVTTRCFLWLQKKPTSSPLHHHAGQWLCNACAKMLCLAFVKGGTVAGQTTPLWSYLLTWLCSRSLVVCSDAVLQTSVMLPSSF